MTPEVIFCDVDETLIRIKSMASFLDFALRRRGVDVEERREVLRALTDASRSRRELNALYYRTFAGWPAPIVRGWGDAWFADLEAETLWERAVVAEVRPAQLDGTPLVLVSGSFDACLDPVAQACSAHAVLCTQLVEADGAFTGEIDSSMLGVDKARAVLAWCAENGVDPARCVAYGDDPSDADMLDAVGSGVAVARSAPMRALAARRGWRTLHVDGR